MKEYDWSDIPSLLASNIILTNDYEGNFTLRIKKYGKTITLDTNEVKDLKKLLNNETGL